MTVTSPVSVDATGSGRAVTPVVHVDVTGSTVIVIPVGSVDVAGSHKATVSADGTGSSKKALDTLASFVVSGSHLPVAVTGLHT